jgi:ribose transport system ATP-binding protein
MASRNGPASVADSILTVPPSLEERAPSPLLEVVGVHKRFGSTMALNGVSLSVQPGSVHGLLGSNGAGKSTLIKVIAGAVEPDLGTVAISGRTLERVTPADVADAGLRTVHQSLDLVPGMSVEENLSLGDLASARNRFRLIDQRTVRNRYEAVAGRFPGRKYPDPRARIADLAIHERYLVAIGRALAGNAVVLVMDEPTAGLDTSDVQALFEIVDHLRTDGLGVVLVSHRLAEVEMFCDEVSVLRNGAVVGTGSVSELGRSRIGSWIAPDMDETPHHAPSAPKKQLDAAQEDTPPLVAAKIRRAGPVRDVHVELRPGSVLGVLGLVGSGRSSLLRTLYGAQRGADATFEVDGRPARIKRPIDALAQGISMLPEDRMGQGLFPGRSVAENLTMMAIRKEPIRSRYGVLRLGQERTEAERLADEHHIVTSDVGQSITELSGGNQQKVLIGRAASMSPRIWLLDQPTSGLDIGAQASLARTVRGLADQGSAVAIADEEMELLFALCDRIIVLNNGRAVWYGRRDDLGLEEALELQLAA